MYNRKFNIKKDFHQLNELENEIMPLIESEKVKNYVRRIFNNQYKQ
jgi:hypothetical protein